MLCCSPPKRERCNWEVLCGLQSMQAKCACQKQTSSKETLGFQQRVDQIDFKSLNTLAA